ncbi:MAG: hypothetical protein WC455_15705 [Dehalococcoidia bacterium]|jgi:hypothetical protein
MAFSDKVSGVLAKVSASKTLVADGNYGANDVLSESKTEGTAFTFSGVASVKGGGGYITGAKLTLSKSGGITAITPRFQLQLYNAAPTCTLNDNEANTGVLAADVSKHIGDIELGNVSQIGGSPVAEVSSSTNGRLPKPFVCTTESTDIYGVLVILDAETNETAATIATIVLYIEQY